MSDKKYTSKQELYNTRMVQSEGNYGKKYSKQPNAWPIPFWPVSRNRMSEVAKKSKQNRQKMWSGNFAKKKSDRHIQASR